MDWITEPHFPDAARTANPACAQYQIPVVYHMELSSTRIADTIAEETGAKVLEFHSCHNVTKEEWEAGATYLELMEGNVEKLKEGLQ